MEGLIPNTWENECEEWVIKLCEKRKDFFAQHKLGDPIDNELFTRNWGDINYRFAKLFFELLEQSKDIVPSHQNFVEEANTIIRTYNLEDLDALLLLKNIDTKLIT